MDPKFQSSFIPKGPAVSSSADILSSSLGRGGEGKNGLLASASLIIFTLSVLLAVGLFGYKYYLQYRIEAIGVDLEEARAAIQPESINQLTRLSDRIATTETLIARHYAFTPLFEFLETSTPVTVRFNDFNYAITENGLELSMRGEARGYAALAFQADIFSQSPHFKNPVFSNLNLNTKGDVSFSFKSIIDPALVSYSKEVEKLQSSLPPQ